MTSPTSSPTSTSSAAWLRNCETIASRLERTVRRNGFAAEKPSPKQLEFLARDHAREALYGGAAGGGKTSTLLMAAAQDVMTPGYAALILRRAFPDLMQSDGLIPRSLSWWANIADWNANERRWTFPSGATLTFGYLAKDTDVEQYQGAAFQFIAIDELTQHTEYRYRYLFSRLRRPKGGPLSQVPLRMRAGTNPGGKGHEWVRKRFVPDEFLSSRDPAKFGRVWWNEGRLFVPARRGDNAFLDQEAYAAALAELDPVSRARLDEGDWSAHSGGHFKAEWFKGFKDIGDAWVADRGGEVARKADCFLVAACDPAGGVSESADYTAVVVAAVTPKGSVLVLEVFRQRVPVERVVSRLADVCRVWRPRWVAIEDAFAQSAYIRQAEAERDIPEIQRMDPGRMGGKLVRATPAILAAENGKVHLPQEHRAWAEDFRAELCAFTGDDTMDAHDDQVDAFAYLILAVQRFGSGGDDGPVGYGRRGG